MVLDTLHGDEITISSVDVIPPGEVENISLYPTEFLNSIIIPQLPLHRLRLKIGCIVLLLRNINTARGLCNGTRLKVETYNAGLLKVSVASHGPFFGQVHFLPRIALYPSQTNLPFTFKRIQFPVALAFAMTINKSQGQTLDAVGLYLTKDLFAHGHLYVALSRTRTGPDGIVYYNPENNDAEVANVVYHEVLLG
jgi:ATP-dependent DNA helicase PIF1